MLGAVILLAILGAEPSAMRRLPKNDPLANVLDGPGMERYKKIILENEHKQLWKQIHWVPVEEAERVAKENRKPVLLIVKTGSGGKAKAAFT
jgi:hypothetical protein